MIIIITEKPETGNVSRVCRICGEPYTGWNYVQCGKHSRNYEVAETWRLPAPGTVHASALAGHV